VLLGAASVASIVANYVFLLAAGRILGSEDYGSLAALLGLLTFVLLPAGALQMAVSREVSRRQAAGDIEGADAFIRATLRLALLATAPLVALALVLAVPLAGVLNIHSVGIVVIAETALVTALAFPVAMGVLQGNQRFRALAAMYVFPFVLRLGLLAVAALLGYRLGGAVVATVAAAIASTAVAIALVREPLRRGATMLRPALAPFLHYLLPVVVGLVGIAVLTNMDILVVKSRFSAHEAGVYAAASAFARVAFFLPATILAVLFPRTAARQARGESTDDILGRALIVTAMFCGLLALFYAAAGRGLLVATFGGDFAQGGSFLAPYALAIGLYSLVHVLVGYHLSRAEPRYAWIVAVGVMFQVTFLALVPTKLTAVVWTNLAVAGALLVAHELFVESSIPALRAGLRHFVAAGAGLRVRGVASEGLLVLLVGTALVCALFWPLVVALGSTAVGDPGSDSAGGIWSFWRQQHEGGYHVLGSTHHTLTGAPFGWDDKGNGYNLQLLLPYYPAYLATKVVGAVAAYNLVLLSGYVLSGASMYLLARYLGCVRLVAAWAGLVYVVFPWHLARTPHASLVHLEFLPLLILAVLAAAERPTWPRFLLVGAATLACWLTSGYFGTMAVVTVGAFAIGAAFAAARRRVGIVLNSAAAAVGASILVGVLSVLSGVGRGTSLERAAGDLTVYGLRPLELVVPAAGNLVLDDRLQSWIGGLHHSNLTETRNYLGLLTVGLAVAWLVVALRGRSVLPPRLRLATAGLVGVVIAALMLAWPSPVGGVWMPSRLLWEVAPAVRVPARWVVVAMTALVPLAALALQATWTRLDRRSRRSRGIAIAPVALVALAMVFSFLELTISPARPRFRTNLPAEYEALERTPRGILVEYPLRPGTDNLSKYTFWQQYHGRPLLNGAPGSTPAGDARDVLVDPAVPGAAAELSLLGVTAIVTHRNALSFDESVPGVANPNWGRGYALVARIPDGASVWRVIAPPAPALVTLPNGFGSAEPPEGGVVGYPLISPSGVGYFGLRAKEPGIVRLTFDAQPPEASEKVLRVADNGAERPFTLHGRTPISVLVQIPRGYSFLLVKTDPPPTSEADAIVFSAARAERASGTPDLHALPVEDDPGF